MYQYYSVVYTLHYGLSKLSVRLSGGGNAQARTTRTSIRYPKKKKKKLSVRCFILL